jgi:histidine triad (HIT) family protein
MFNHAPADYDCPFCRIVAGVESPQNGYADVVARTDGALALISPRWWPGNEGHAIVVPLAHHESLYDIPPEYGYPVYDLIQQVAIAMRKSYDCHGISTRQHNEPAGNQDVWHFHTHVFPRYDGDELYLHRPLPDIADASQRRPYADRLRAALEAAGPASAEA